MSFAGRVSVLVYKGHVCSPYFIDKKMFFFFHFIISFFCLEKACCLRQASRNTKCLMNERWFQNSLETFSERIEDKTNHPGAQGETSPDCQLDNLLCQLASPLAKRENNGARFRRDVVDMPPSF